MSIKISEMDADTTVGGAEMIPVSDAGTAKRITPDQLAAYAIDQAEAIAAGSSVTGSDSVFVLQGGAMKPVDIDLVCQHAIDTIWGKAAETAPDSADVLALKDGGTTEKTVTLALLAEYVRATVEATILDVSDLADGSGTLASSDFLLVTQGTTAKQICVSDITALIYASLAAHVAALSSAGTTADADVLYILQSGVAKKITLANLIAHYGAAVSGSGTADYLAQWSSSSALKAGPTIVASGAGFAAGTDTQVPTTAAVRGEMNTIVYDATDIGDALVDADLILVDDGAAGTAQRHAALSRIWTYISGKIGPVIGTLTSQVLAIGDFTDDAGISGHIDFTSGTLPAGALVLGVRFDVTTGFTGDTSAEAYVGDSSDDDRFSGNGHSSVVAAGSDGHSPDDGSTATPHPFCVAAVTPRVTIDGGAAFASITAGSMTCTIYYLETAT